MDCSFCQSSESKFTLSSSSSSSSVVTFFDDPQPNSHPPPEPFEDFVLSSFLLLCSPIAKHLKKTIVFSFSSASISSMMSDVGPDESGSSVFSCLRRAMYAFTYASLLEFHPTRLFSVIRFLTRPLLKSAFTA